MRLHLTLAAAALGLAACASEPAPAPAPEPAPAPAPAAVAPGAYSGRAVLAANQARSCRPARAPVAIRVVGTNATANVAGDRGASGPIGADGSVTIAAGHWNLAGKFEGRGFAGTATHGTCNYTVTAAMAAPRAARR